MGSEVIEPGTTLSHRSSRVHLSCDWSQASGPLILLTQKRMLTLQEAIALPAGCQPTTWPHVTPSSCLPGLTRWQPGV